MGTLKFVTSWYEARVVLGTPKLALVSESFDRFSNLEDHALKLEFGELWGITKKKIQVTKVRRR